MWKVNRAILVDNRAEGVVTEKIDGVREGAGSGAFVEFFEGLQNAIWFEVERLG